MLDSGAFSEITESALFLPDEFRYEKAPQIDELYRFRP